MNNLDQKFRLKNLTTKKFSLQVDFYTIILVQEGKGIFYLDDTKYSFQGPIIFFATPFQKIEIKTTINTQLKMIQFHGDFYCIEFHKSEVGCNGLLFNNIFLSPLVQLSSQMLSKVKNIWKELTSEFDEGQPEWPILIAYLQLLLARASSIKLKQISKEEYLISLDDEMMALKALIESNYNIHHSPSFYAKALGMPINTLTKKCKKHFGRSPRDLIQERIIVEAKRRLHLTRQLVKQISYELNFKDEYYFSRFFKKRVNMSPIAFREAVGIARVADLSILNP